MSMIFPGMDPYLEYPAIWHGFHNRLIVYLADHLQPLIEPRYLAAVEDRDFVEGPDREVNPDVWLTQSSSTAEGLATAAADGDAPVLVRVPELEIHESFINILDRQSGQKVVTTLEVVSPTNKYAGPGRKLYLDKQQQVRESETHLVEVDLLRTGPHVLAVPEWVARGQGAYDYLVCVNRAQGLRDEFELYPLSLRQRLPRVRMPLADGDPDVPLDLQEVVAQTYHAGRYRRRIAYDIPCRPPLTRGDQRWASQLIRRALRLT